MQSQGEPLGEPDGEPDGELDAEPRCNGGGVAGGGEVPSLPLGLFFRAAAICCDGERVISKSESYGALLTSEVAWLAPISDTSG